MIDVDYPPQWRPPGLAVALGFLLWAIIITLAFRGLR